MVYLLSMGWLVIAATGEKEKDDGRAIGLVDSARNYSIIAFFMQTDRWARPINGAA